MCVEYRHKKPAVSGRSTAGMLDAGSSAGVDSEGAVLYESEEETESGAGGLMRGGV